MTEPTPLAGALARVGDRWTLLIVDALLGGPARFGDLAAAVAGIAPNILSDRLRRLEADGLLVSLPYSERPPAASTASPARGRPRRGPAPAHRLGCPARPAPGPEHRTCGTPLEAAGSAPPATGRSPTTRGRTVFA